jgi:hypothetical protein
MHVAEVFYKRILWGDDPRIILHALRGKLSTLCPDTHDWASLVMYASLPPDIETQLLEVRYTQAKKAIDNALARIDEANDLDKKVQTGPSEETIFLDEMERNKIIARVEAAASYMPITEGYETEGRGMLASTEKRKAEVYFRAICDQKAEAPELKKRCLDHLWKSLSLYEQAYRENMREAEGIIRKNRSVHWVMTQYLSLRAVLGKPILPDHWGSAKVSAEVDMDVRSWNGQAQTVAWAHGSLAELYLILMAYDPADIEYHLGLNQEQIRQEALEHTQKVLSISGQGSFLVASTLRQFKRYLTWWGNDNFEALLAGQNIPRPRSWSDEDDNKVSLNALAKQLISELEKPIG